MSVYDEFQVVLDAPMEYNERFLMKILQDNKDTEYGRKYDFQNIHSVKEFQEKVPVSVYDDYADYILRMTENSEENLICSYPVNHYNKTSGTMGNPKRIPMSDESWRIYSRYTGGYLAELMEKLLDGKDWKCGKTLMMMEAKPKTAVLKCGATYGAISEKTLLARKDTLELYHSSPIEAFFPEAGTNTRYLHARFGLMDENIVSIGGTFYSFFAELLRYIETNWQMLVADIESGTIDESVSMSDSVRKALQGKIKPMPERAARLREIFSQGFDEPFVPKVWPKFCYISGTGSAGFQVYADKIKEHYTGDGITQLKFGISASEGCMSLCYAADTNNGVLIPDGMFYEFLPIDAGDDFSQIVTLDGLEEGKDYELIITNASGFYRYRMRDAIRVTGRYRNTPTIDFLYRIDKTVSIMGEKTTEIALQNAANETAKELGFDLVGFSMLPDLDANPVCYRFYMEIANNPGDIHPKEIRYVLERKLAAANPSMGDKVKKGICGATSIYFLEPETYMLYRDLMVSKGTAAGQVKPVVVIGNETQRKFFNGLTEYSVEVYK